jgi:hydroxymethylpyrimidine pyrophosphatase-like HAD family hydrolase
VGRIKAILSDYDGTLVPAFNVKDPMTNYIPGELKEILEKISSDDIPICIISTKDFEFLRNKTASFAKILSCITGIETIVFSAKEDPVNAVVNSSARTIEKRILNTTAVNSTIEILEANSYALKAIAEEITLQEDFSEMIVEQKHTTDGILAGITIDWRHLDDHRRSEYRRGIFHFVWRMVENLKRLPVPINLYIQQYSTHPFIDIYSIECNKGIAFDTVFYELASAEAADVGMPRSANRSGSIIYLGDSENDNPAFRRASIPIGIHSDARLNPKLDCKYFLNYKELVPFLIRLRENDYVFTNEMMRNIIHEQA